MTGQSSASVPLYAPALSSCSSSVSFCFSCWFSVPLFVFQCLRSPVSGFLGLLPLVLFFLCSSFSAPVRGSVSLSLSGISLYSPLVCFGFSCFEAGAGKGKSSLLVWD
ncbi:hypothetical protein NC651_027236 [Populus alba x Populus x berolinensis]|nr:hypothetical protein NC651_027236 [Populus alba x Populus x berolinensis]